MTTTSNGSGVTAIGGTSPTNDAAPDIEVQTPFMASVTITGTTPLLFHRWSAEAVEEKKKAPKGSKAKNDDNLESYLWRDDDGIICLPGLYLLGALTDPRNGAAKYRQDPRSPRKSALDLYRAGVSALTELAPVTSARTGAPSKDWDFLDERRAMVQRSAINRIRPAFLTGWEATVQFLVVTPEYISPEDLLDAFNVGGRLVGVGDFRPTFGRFVVTRFDAGFDD